MAVPPILIDLRSKILALLDKIHWLPITVGRLTSGYVFLESGWGKLHNLPKVIEFFRHLGIPAPELQAPFVAAVEFAGGVALLIGLMSRLASLPLIGTMIVALLTAKREDIVSLSALVGMTEFLYLILLGWIVVEGPGPISLDSLLVHRVLRRESGRDAPRLT